MNTTSVKVLTEEKCYDSYHSGEEFGDWYEHKSFDVLGVSLTGEGETVTIPGDVSVGDTVYVLYMIYSTGDSFGHSQGNGEVLFVFTDKDVANKALKQWNENQDEIHVVFKATKDMEVRLSNPAYGYFEHVDVIDIDEFQVTA